MGDLFEQIKNAVNIKEFIESATSTRAKKVGSSLRIVPCPFCDSKTGFTVNEGKQFFRCFSCGKGGDVIAFEELHGRHESPLEAAKKIAQQYNIPVKLDPYRHPLPPRPSAGSQDSPPELPEETEAPPPETEPPEHLPDDSETPPEASPLTDSDSTQETSSKIAPARACEVRRICADYYHARLMSSPDALAYQRDQRKHSVEILERLQVGLGGGSLISHCRAQGVTTEELVGVGLVQETSRGFRSTVSAGVFVYPHFKGDDVLFFTLKDPEKKKPWQLKKAFAPKEWICYGQDALDQEGVEAPEPVIIVEGENDRISIMDLGEWDHVIATIASYNEPAILKKLKSIAKNRTWVLCFDNEPPRNNQPESAGDRYTRVYANALFAASGDVRLVDLPKKDDGGKVDIDDVLRAAEDPAVRLRELTGSTKKITEPIKDPQSVAGAGSLGPEDGGDPYKFKSFEVLGELFDEKILFWSKVNERLYAVALRDLQLDKLVQIGGIEVAARVARSSKDGLAPGQVLFNQLKKRLIVQAGKRQLWNPEFLGQGFHSLKKGMLAVVGGEAWIWDGTKLSKWSHPVIENRLIEWRRGNEWVDMARVSGLLRRMDRKSAGKVQEELLEVVFQWRFQGSLDVVLLTGWFLAQWVQAIWPWRPHLWMTGTSGSGKSIMRELMTILGGRLALPCEGQTLTEPGLRQGIGCDSVLVAIDEIEESENRDKIIKFIRSAGRGGITRKGTSGQRAIAAELKHMVFLGSVERGLYRAAENSRYLIVETRKSSDCRPLFPGTVEADKLREKIVAYVIWAAFRARKLVEEVGKIGESDPRFVESLSVAFAMIAVVYEDPAGNMRRLIVDYIGGVDVAVFRRRHGG